jgi:hypothetical protein
MKRLAFFALVLWFSCTHPVAQDQAVVIDVPNAGKLATAPRVIEQAMESPGNIFALVGADGKHVPATYDNKAKVLRFLAEVPPGGGKYTIKPDARSNAPRPIWKKYKFDKKKLKIDDKKTIDWVSGDVENGLLNVTIQPDNSQHGKIEITTLEGKYRLRMSPLGQSVGCVENEADAKKVADDYEKKVVKSDEVFFITPCIPTKVSVEDPNPYQRVVTVTCFDYARRNDDKVLKLFEYVCYEITLTWKSPVVQVKSTRKLKTSYYNHNGVNLNEIYVDVMPIGLAVDGGLMTDAQPSTRGKAMPFEFERAMMIRDRTGTTAIMQPDFRKLAIYKECVVLTDDRIMTLQSQCWHEGWKAIEIKAGEYTDTVTLACDVADAGKTVAEWEIELIGAPPPKEEKKEEPMKEEPKKEEPKGEPGKEEPK